MPVAKVTRLLPRFAESYRALVDDLGNLPEQDIGRARAELRRIYGGEIHVRPAARGDFLEARVPKADRLFELAVANGSSLRNAEAVDGATASTRTVAGACNRTRKRVRIR